MEKSLVDVHRCLGNNTAFPVVLVSTRTNLITAAMVHYFSFEPATIGVAIHRDRHSFGLIRAERAFGVNLLTRDQVALAEGCGNLSGRDVDKFAHLGLTRTPATRIAAALVGECPVNIECELVREVEFDERVWFIGQAVAVHQAPGYDKTQTLLYAGGEYFALGENLGQRHG